MKKAGIRKEPVSNGTKRQINRSEEVLQHLRKRIADHDLPPGTRLQELEIAEQFDISRAVVREVLGALEQRGLVNRIPNRGAVVARLDIKEIFDIFDVRERLEGLCAYRATINAPPKTWDPYIEQFGADMKQAISEGDIERYIDGLEALRAEMIRWADNSYAASFLDLLLDKARIIARRVTLLPGRAAAGRSLHLEMLELMKAGNAADAERKKMEIIRSARECLERYRTFIM